MSVPDPMDELPVNKLAIELGNRYRRMISTTSAPIDGSSRRSEPVRIDDNSLYDHLYDHVTGRSRFSRELQAAASVRQEDWFMITRYLQCDRHDRDRAEIDRRVRYSAMLEKKAYVRIDSGVQLMGGIPCAVHIGGQLFYIDATYVPSSWAPALTDK